MRKSAHALASLLAAASLVACGTVHERDCRVLLPRLEEADEATALTGNARGDATRVYAMQAARSAAAARWLENATIASEDIKRGIAPLVEALGRHGDAANRGDGALRALGFDAQLRVVAKAVTEQQATARDVAASSAALRAMCRAR